MSVPLFFFLHRILMPRGYIKTLSAAAYWLLSGTGGVLGPDIRWHRADIAVPRQRQGTDVNLRHKYSRSKVLPEKSPSRKNASLCRQLCKQDQILKTKTKTKTKTTWSKQRHLADLTFNLISNRHCWSPK